MVFLVQLRQFLKTGWADHMLHVAGVLFGGFGLYTGLYQQACEEAVLFIGLLGYLPAYIGQTEEEVPIHGKEAPSFKVATAWHTLGLDTPMCRATFTERTMPFFLWSTSTASR